MKRLTLGLFFLSMILGCNDAVVPADNATETRRSAVETYPAGYAPEGFDLQGTWVFAPGESVSSVDDEHVCFRETKKDNYLSVGRNTLTFEVDEIEFQGRVLIARYTGSYSRYDGFGTDVPGGAEYGCVLQNIEYEIEAELRVDIVTRYASFGGVGTARTSATYSYPTTLRFNAINAGAGGDLWLRGDPSELNIAFGFDDYMGLDEVPDGCDFALRDVYYREYDVGRGCIPVRQGGLRFTQTNPMPNIDPGGEIRGVVEEALPDGTPTSRKVERASVALYRQPRARRAQRNSESDEDYRNYLDALQRERVFVASVNLTPQDMGEFVFEDVKPFQRNPSRPGTFRQAEYTVEVTQARSTPLVADPQFDEVFFENGTEYDVKVEDDVTLQLKPFDALGQKIAIAESLQTKAPLGWGADEGRILTTLYALRDGTLPKTPEANESVRRAVWAEMAARDGLRHADTLMDFLLDALASLAQDFLIPDINLNPRKIAKAQKRMRDFSPEAARAQSSLDVLQSARIEDMHRRVEAKALGARVSGSKAKRAGQIKAIAKAAVFNPAKVLAENFSSNASQINGAIDAVAMGFNAIVDVVITGNVGGFVQDLLKKAVGDIIKSTKGRLLDNNSAVFPSFTDMASAAVARTDANIDVWSTADRPAYNADRNAAINKISDMNSEASNLVGRLEISKGLADGAAASEDAFAALSAIPAFRGAEKAAKAVKILATLELFVDPLVYTFFELPNEVNAAGYLAWGEPLPATNNLIYNGDLVAENTRVRDDYFAAAAAYRSKIDAIQSALEADDGESFIDQTFGTESEPGLDELWDEFVVRRARYHAQGAGWTANDAVLERIQDRVALDLKKQSMHGRVTSSLLSFAVDLLTGAFPLRNDWYDMRKRAVISKLNVHMDRFDTHRHFYTDDEFLAQLVTIENLRIEDNTGDTLLDTSQAATLTVTADVVNLSVASIEDVEIELEATAVSGQVSVSQPVVSAQPLGAYDGSSNHAESLSWTIEYTPGGAGDRVIVNLDPIEDGAPPTRYNGVGATAEIAEDPALFDADLDGLPDAWEAQYGLDLSGDDWNEDPDGDGVENRIELAFGLDPSVSDTDGDGRADGDELYGSTDRGASDPLVADTDGDGIDDAADLAPLDETTAEASDAPEPCISVDVSEIYLTRESPGSSLQINNGCDGELGWSARVEDPDMVQLFLVGNSNPAGPLVLSSAMEFDIRTLANQVPRPSTRLYVYDVTGRTPDAVIVDVFLGPKPEGPTGEDMGADTGNPDAADMGSPGESDLGQTPMPPSPKSNDSDSGCSVAFGHEPFELPLILVLFIGYLGIRRRIGASS